MIIGAQLYTVRDFCRTPEDIHSTLVRLSKMGYKSVQLSGVGAIDYSLFKNYCDELSLSIAATHMPFARITSDTDNLIADHEILDCDYIGIGCPTPEQYSSPDNFKAFIDALCVASEKINAAGKHFAYHNHHIEFTEMEGGFMPIEYMLKTFPSHVNYIVDTYWVQYAGSNPAAHLKRIPGQIACVHFKDMKITEAGEKPMAPVMEGVLDWKEIISACEAGGTKWAVVEQDICDGDPFDCLEISYNNLKAAGLE